MMVPMPGEGRPCLVVLQAESLQSPILKEIRAQRVTYYATGIAVLGQKEEGVDPPPAFYPWHRVRVVIGT
jgi:hypothetical protein